MSRTLTEIYNEAVETRNKYLELTEQMTQRCQ